jgi:tetratricopeptide (TPR) repeat protein
MFEWIARLAYSAKMSINEGWVTLEQIQQLPLWSKMTRHHAGGNVYRYLMWLQNRNLPIVATENATRGRYRLRIERSDIYVDVPMENLATSLGILHHAGDEPTAEEMLKFLSRHFRAVALMNRWRLSPEPGHGSRWRRTAYGIWMELADNETFHPAMRLLAYVCLATVLDERGQYQSRKKLMDGALLLVTENVPRFLLARLYLGHALLLHRDGGADALNEEQVLLEHARMAGTGTQDRFLTGIYASRIGLRCEREGRREEALIHFSSALWSYTLIESYEKAHDACYNIARVLQNSDRLQAREWLKLALFVAERMKVGTSRIMIEVLLGKIALELNDHARYVRLLREAEKHSCLSRSPIDKTWCHFLRALDFARGGSSAEPALISELTKARKLYIAPGYNWRKLDEYFASKFGRVWEKVIKMFP